MTEKIKKYGYFFTFAIIFALGFFLRLKLLIANPSFWDDECSLAWNVLHKNYTDFFSVLNFVQVAPPFFMIMAKFFTKLFGESDFVLRLTPFIFGIASMFVFLSISKHIFKNKSSIIISNFLFTINQTLINYSSEFKHYSCDVFFTLLIIYLFLNILTENINLRRNIIYSFIFVFSIWFSFVSVFSIMAGIIILILRQLKTKGINLKQLSILLIPFIISLILYSKIYITNTYTANINDLMKCDCWINSFLNKNLSNLWFLITFNIKYFFYPIKFPILALAFMLVGIIRFYKSNFYYGLFFSSIIILAGFASWLNLYPFANRAVLFLLPIVLLFFSSAFEIFHSKVSVKLFVFYILFVITFIPAIYSEFNFIFHTPRPTRGFYDRQMMAEMSKRIEPNDVIVINYYSQSDFAYYSTFYKFKNKILIEPLGENSLDFNTQLTKHKRYWVYNMWGKSKRIDDWIDKHKNQIIFSITGNGYGSKLICIDLI